MPDYIKPLIQNHKEFFIPALLQTGQVTFQGTPDCVNPGSCQQFLGYQCVNRNWQITYELTNSDCNTNPLTSCQLQILEESNISCTLNSCTTTNCPSGSAVFVVTCSSTDVPATDCTGGDTITITCPAGNSSPCTDIGEQ